MTDTEREQMVAEVMGTAKANLAKDNFLTSMAMILGAESKILPAIFKGQDEKIAFYMAVGEISKENNAHTVILVSDAAMRRLTNPEDFEKAIRDPLEQPLTYPKSMRMECIIVSVHDFTTGKSSTLVQVYKDDTGRVEYVDEVEKMGNFNVGLLEWVKEGYGKCPTP
jgi:hypothetical protein